MMNKTAFLVWMLTAILLIGVVCPCAAAEFRAFWIDAWGAGIENQSQVDTLLGVPGTSSTGQMRDANCNAIVVQVRRDCNVNYPSGVGEPYMSGLTPSNFNGLQAAINAAHDTTGGKKRIEVHVWLVTFRTTGGAVYGLHHDTPTGSLTTLDNYWPTRDNTGAEVSPDLPFDPGHPLAEEYIVNVGMDLVNNFDIDGIHYDYIRFTANNQGYNPTSVARYNARFGLSGQPASTDAQFQQWRRDQVSCFVRKMYAKIQAVKPWVKQSGSFVTWNPSPTASTRAAFQATRPYYDVYSDWDSWIQEGIVDAAIPMTYYDYSSLPADWTRWMNWEKDRHGTRHMYIGPGIYLNSLSNGITELQQTRTASPAGNYADGFCGYSYRTPYVSGTWAGFSPSLVSGVTPTWTDIPTMSWKASPTKGHISGTITNASSGAWADGATVAITGPETRSMLCDGTGFYAFIDLTPGAYTVTASRSGYANLVTPVNVAVGSVTGNMYVTNFALGSAPKPVITNVQATGITTTSATISWTTDLASSSQVQYGLTTGYGLSTTLDPSLVTSHSQGLSGLAPGTLYHYRVLSANANGTTYSNDYTFITVGPPAITGVTASGITNATATVTWTTDQSASSQIQYGLTTGYGSSTTLNSSLVTSHSQGLSSLAANTLYHYRVISSNVNGTTTSGDYTFTTSGPPVITNVQATSITATSTTITWTTNAASDSRINYGLTISYGSQVTNASAVTSHSMLVTGLTASTTYHYQCVSVNAYGTATTGDYTFATIAVPVEIIVDDAAAVYSGSSSWTAATGAGYDNTYHYGNNRATNITRICTWTPAITTGGYYNVYCTYPSGMTTPTANAIFSVNYNGGSASASFNQANNTDTWNLVASNVPFAAGTTGNVVLNNMTGETNGSKRVTADAVKFVYIGGTPPPADVIVDDVDAGASSTGAWTIGTSSLASSYNNSYRFCYNDASTETASHTWTPTIATSGTYNVFCYYPSGGNRTVAAHYTLNHAVGSASATVNQTVTGSQWVQIGTNLPFATGTSGYVKMDNITGEATGAKVIMADAIKWVYTGSYGGGDTTPPTVSIGAPSASATRSGPITYTINYSDDVGVTAITLANANVTLNKTGTANGTVNVTGSGTGTRTVTISGITGDGTLGISIAAGTAVDAASNLALAAGPSSTFGVDNTAPNVSIGTPSGTLASSGPITYTITYSGADAVTLANANVTLNKTSTANGTVAVTGSGTATRTVTVSSITGDGTLGISIAAGTASDNAGNMAGAAGPSSTFSVDNTAPTLTSVTDEVYTTSTTSLQGWWSASDAGSGILRYDYAVGTTPGGTDVRGWTARIGTWATITGQSLTVGDTYFFSARAVDNAGLVSAPMSSAGVKIARPVAGIPAALALSNGVAIALPARLVTAAFAGKFYIEEANRAAGIRVESGDAISVGQSVTVLGVLGLADGERAILSPKVITGPTETAIKPLSVTGKSVGSAGDNGTYNIGLLLRVAGKVSSHASGSFILDDGSGATVKIYSDVAVTDTAFVGATGISALETGQRVIRTRNVDDVQIYAP